MNWSTPVRHVMTADPVHVDVDVPPSGLARRLDDVPFHHLPVVDGDTLVGVVSTIDLARHSLGLWVPDRQTEEAWLDRQFDIRDIMTWEPETVTDTDTVRVAAERLAEGRFHALPVVDAAGALVGIVTSTDLLRWMLAQ